MMAALSVPPTTTKKAADDVAEPEPSAVVLSAGAAQALGSVAQRLLQKRPRGVLSDNAEVAAESAELIVAGRKEREAKRAKRSFELNARVVPDAATNAPREKALKHTATRGTVALFNAVSRAQRESGGENAGKPVDRNTFMNLMKRGTTAPEEDKEEEEEKAGWLKDDYLTAKSRKLKDFDRAADADGEGDGDDDDDEEEEEYEDEAEFESEEEEESEELEEESESE